MFKKSYNGNNNYLLKQDTEIKNLCSVKKPCICPQVILGIHYLIIAWLNINVEGFQNPASILNDVIVFAIFLVTLINIVISGFGVRTTDAVDDGLLLLSEELL